MKIVHILLQADPTLIDMTSEELLASLNESSNTNNNKLQESDYDASKKLKKYSALQMIVLEKNINMLKLVIYELNIKPTYKYQNVDGDTALHFA